MRKNWGAEGGRLTSSSSFATTTNQFCTTTSCLLVCLGLHAARHYCQHISVTKSFHKIWSQHIWERNTRKALDMDDDAHCLNCSQHRSHTQTHTHTCLHIQDQILRVLWIECWEFWKTDIPFWDFVLYFDVLSVGSFGRRELHFGDLVVCFDGLSVGSFGRQDWLV